MTFRFEAIPAKYGDCLLITFPKTGEARSTRLLVDGGPPGVFRSTLRDRLEKERLPLNETPLVLDAIMVSHIDQDHIAGILDLLASMKKADQDQVQRPYKPIWLLHNGLDAIAGAGLGTAGRALGGPASLAGFGVSGPLALDREPHPVTAAVLQSYPEAVRLGTLAGPLNVARNPPDQSLLVAGRAPLPLGDATLRILGPLPEQVDAFRKEWAKKVKTVNAAPAALAEYLDTSVPNLASIVALLTFKGKTTLLTGDARGDVIVEACRNAGLLVDGKLKVDILKVPHHGSDRDLETSFFKTIEATHYVISANGRFGNPDRPSLEMLETGTGKRKIHVYLTVAAELCDIEQEEWRRTQKEKYNAAKHAITPIVTAWKAGKRITVSEGPVSIDLD